jgi:Family of unknown function (DUF6130)
MKRTTRLTRGAAVILGLFAATAVAEDAKNNCSPAKVIPLTADEPPAKLHVNAPLPEPLASRGVVVIEYCAENVRLIPVFGPNALAVTPRIGHIHVRVDRAPYVWAEASGNPVILLGLSPGSHEVLLELNDANHRKLDEGTVRFVVPEPAMKTDQ